MIERFVYVVGWVLCLAICAGDGFSQTLYPHSAKLTGSGSLDYFGRSVALSGDRLVVSAAYYNDVDDPGSVSVYDISDPASPVELYELLPPTPNGDDDFGSDVAVDGDLLLIGAARAHGAFAFSGAAYLYQLSTGQFLSTLVATSANPVAQFGLSVDLDGDLAVIGSPSLLSTSTSAGAAYIFDISVPASPVELARLTPSDAENEALAGYSVAIDGSAMVMGAPFQRRLNTDGSLTTTGAAYVYDLATPSSPSLLYTFQPQPTLFTIRENARYGFAVDISGDNILIGAPDDILFTLLGGVGGSATTHSLADGSRKSQNYHVPSEFGEEFGSSVAVSGDTAVVAARAVGIQLGEFTGAAYVFDLTLPQDEQIGELINPALASGDYGHLLFGESVAFDGANAAVGSIWDSDIEFRSGATYLYELFQPSCLSDTNGDGLLTPADFNAWVIAFNNQAPECDQNGDGLCTPADFNAWVINFNAGC